MAKLQPPPVSELSVQFPKLGGWLRDIWRRIGRDTVGSSAGTVLMINDSGNFEPSAFYVGDDYIGIGDPETEGSWRLQISGTTLEVQRRESDAWVKKGAFRAS